MSSILSRRSKNSIIGMRIQILSSLNNCCDVKDCSPVLKGLRDTNSSRVKNCLELFEKKPWCVKSGCNWWLEEWSPGALTAKTEPNFKPLDPTPVKAESSRLKEVLKMEQKHVAELKDFILKISEAVRAGRGYIAMKLRDHTISLFGDLKTIHGLHKIVILSKLSAFSECIHFVSLLIQLIDDGQFYCYVRHQMYETMMNKLHREYVFLSEAHASAPKPFNMLEFYHKWTSNICNELMRNPLQNSNDIAICVEAEKKLMDLMDLVSDAESVTNISQVSEVPLEVQFKIMDIVKKKEEIYAPMMLLVPKRNLRFSYRYPIDIMQLGQFIKSFEFPMISKEYGYQNNAKFFVFEKCIMYTTVINSNRFCFENHFWTKDITFGVLANERIFAELKNCDHKVHVDDSKMVMLVRNLKIKHKDDELTAEIDGISDYDLIKLVDSVEDAKKWRRHSVVSIK